MSSAMPQSKRKSAVENPPVAEYADGRLAFVPGNYPEAKNV
jgi:hypothetical protein